MGGKKVQNIPYQTHNFAHMHVTADQKNWQGYPNQIDIQGQVLQWQHEPAIIFDQKSTEMKIQGIK